MADSGGLGLYQDGFYSITSGDGYCVDNSGGSLTNGNRIQLWQCVSGNTNQLWTLSQVDTNK